MSDPDNAGYREPWLRVGAREWDRPAWRGRFFPPDLPEDWRLTYYATTAQAVLVPRDVWANAAEAAWRGWAGDVPPVFRFYLELDGPQDRGAAARCAAVLGARAGGLLLARSGAERLEPVGNLPVLLPPVAAPVAGARFWSDPEHLEAGPPPAALLLKTAGRSLRDLRVVLDSFGRRRDGGWGQALFVLDPTSDGAPLAELRTLAELMGLS
jgi:hypothetical protein